MSSAIKRIIKYSGILIGLAIFSFTAFQIVKTTAQTSIVGTWECCGSGGAAAQNFIITSDAGGSLAGRAELPDGSVFADITGTISGEDVRIITTYTSFSAGYVGELVGKISADGNSMSGTWTSNAGQSGTWTATRSGQSAPAVQETTENLPRSVDVKSTFTPIPGGVRQTIEVIEPKEHKVTFGYCNAQVCGTSENVSCIGNKYIPDSSDPFLNKLTVSPIPGFTKGTVMIASGVTTGTTTGEPYAIIPKSFSTSSNGVKFMDFAGGVQFTTESPNPLAALAPWYRPEFQRVCGLSEGERDQFVIDHPNFSDSTNWYKFTIDWLGSGIIAEGTTQNITINDRQPQSTAVSLEYSADFNSSDNSEVFRQFRGDWANKDVGGFLFRDVGTVATSVATFLSGYGIATDPGVVGDELIAARTWIPGTGTNWQSLQRFIETKGLIVEERKLADVLSLIELGQSALVALSDGDKEKTVVITGYYFDSDEFDVIDPVRGRTKISFEKFVEGNPWILTATR